MNLSSNISLAHQSSIAVVSSLWNKEDVIADVKCVLEDFQFSKRWSDIESNVMLHLRKIILPVKLKSNLENFVEPMGMELFKWITLTESFFKAFRPIPENIRFFWTEKGNLDFVKTTMFIIDHSHHKDLNFCLACLFCIEKTIYELWPEVGRTIGERIRLNPYDVESVLVLYWVYFINGDVETLMTLTEYCGIKNVYEFAFLFFLDMKCPSTLRYFLEHIDPQRRKKGVHLALQRIFVRSKCLGGNVLAFLFRYLDESEVNKVISEHAYSVLSSLLEWPCQELFMPLVQSHWNNLTSVDCQNLFQDIVEYVSRYSGFLYRNIAEEFWKSAPPPHKEYVINKCKSGTFLSRLFLRQNTYEIIEMMFEECSPGERQQMIFYFEGMNVCDLLVKREKWDYLKLFVTSCLSSREDLEKFITSYKNQKSCYWARETELRFDVLKEKIREWY